MSLTKKIGIAVLCAAVSVAAIFAVKSAMDTGGPGDKNGSNDSKIEDVSSSNVKDGEYYGEAEGYGGLLKVKVTIKNGKIVNVEVVSNNETPEYFSAAKEVINRIISSGSVDVDSVSGATVSSNAIKRAVADALSKAGIKTGDLKNSKATPSRHGKIVPASKRSTRAGSIGLLAENVADGTYDGVGSGYGGPIRVRVIVRNGNIISVKVLSHNETTQGPVNYYANGRSVISRILGAPGKRVNTVSGATLTSRGIIDAVNDALSKAPGRPSAVVPGTKPNPNIGGTVPNVAPQQEPPVILLDNTPLEDGEWYGTATDGQNYRVYGPSVVKVKVKNGKIVEVLSERYTDDDKIYLYKKENLLKALAGLDLKNVNEASRQIHKKNGKYYDVVSGATFTGRGHITAVLGALKNSARAYRNRQNGQTAPNKPLIIWLEKKGKLDNQYFGSPLNLDKIKLIAHYSDKTEREIKFSELDKYGIKCNWKNGQILKPDSEGVKEGNYISVEFTQGDTETNLTFDVPIGAKKIERYATHVQIKYTDGTEDRVALNKEDFRYEFKPKKEISKAALFENSTKLADGVYRSDSRSYDFDIKMKPGEGYSWIFTGYRLDIKDESIASMNSFTVKPSKNEYKVGDKLDLSGTTVSVKFSDSSSKNYSWSEAEAAGFKSNPRNGTEFTTAGHKSIIIFKNVNGKTLEQSFDINVTDGKPNAAVNDQVPSKLEIYDGYTLLESYDKLDGKAFIDGEGYLMVSYNSITLPMALKNNLNKDLKFKVYNKNNELLDAEALNVKGKKIAGHDVVDIKITNYNSTFNKNYFVGNEEYNTGYLRILVDWEKSEIDQVPNKVEVMSEGKKVVEYNIDGNGFKELEGYAMANLGKPLKLPLSLKDKLNKDVVFKVYNKNGDVLRTEALNAGAIGNFEKVDVKILDYSSPKYFVANDNYKTGYIRILIDWDNASEMNSTPKSASGVAAPIKPSVITKSSETDSNLSVSATASANQKNDLAGSGGDDVTAAPLEKENKNHVTDANSSEGMTNSDNLR